MYRFSGGDRVVVEWETAAERNTAGFSVYRQDPGSAQRVKVNEGIVPASLTTTAGGTYRLLDPGAQPDGTYVYTLQEIEAGGGSRQYGPFTVTADEGGTAASMFSREAGMVYERVVHPATLPVQPTEPEPNTGTEVPTALPGATQQEADSLPFRVYLPLIQGHGAVTPATRLAKLTVRASSLYYLAAEDIASALGLSVNRAADLIALTRLKLSNQGQGVAYLPASGNAGLYFYAEGLDSLYTWDNVYWLEQAEGLSFGTQSAPVPAAVDVATFATTVHAEQNVQPVLGLLNDPAADYWMWDFVVAADPQSGSQSFGLHTDGAVPKGQASITAHFLGVTELGTGADHHARILLNGTTIGQAAWTGAVPYEVSPAFDSALLRDGTNTIEVVGMLDTGVPYSIFCVDSFEVSYQRQYRAVNDRLAFPSLDDQAITVYGFTDKNIMVFDLSNSYRPVQVNKTAVEAWEGAYRVTLKPAAAGVPYLALTTTAVPGVTTLAPDSPSALKGPNGAESLIITTAGLMEPAGALAAYRQGQGLQSQVVDVQDIYDEFNGGVASPEAVQAFLAYAYAHWSPDLRYVLLAGTGSYDYKNVLGYSDCLVPPILVGSVDHLAAADGRYEDVLGNDGTPELAVGRLPVVTAAEFEAYVTKIQAYEAADPTDWSKQVLMLANNADPSAGDFPADSDSLAALLPAEYTAQEVYLGPLSRAEARSQTLTALDSGVGASHYVGHAGLSTLAAEGLLTSADVPGLQNSPRLPFMSAATCAVGDYAQPGYRSLGVLLALQGNGGMGAVFPPTGWSLNANGVALDTLLFQQLFEGNALRAGDASRAALAQYTAGGGPRYILDTYNLLGHPTMEMRWR